MNNKPEFESGDIIISRLHPKMGEFVSRERGDRGEVIVMRYLCGTMVRVPLGMVRPASEEEAAEFKRRKNPVP